MISLSVYIITKNEENRLPLVLESVKKIADEIVVVDSGSTDSTEAIVKRYGGRFIFHEWESVGHQVAFAERCCSHDWVLRLDADEELSNGLVQEILEVKRIPEFDGYRLRIGDMYPGYSKPRRWAKHYKLTRLYDRKKMAMSGRLGFDDVEPVAGNIRLITLKHFVNHYSYLSIRNTVDKINRETDFQVVRALDERKNYSAWRMVGAFSLEFFKYYILGRHFLYGFWGFINCMTLGYSRLLKFAKYYEYGERQKHVYPPVRTTKGERAR